MGTQPEVEHNSLYQARRQTVHSAKQTGGYNEKQGQGLQERGYGIHDVHCLLQKQMLPTPQSKKRSVPSICPGHLQESHLGSQPHVLGNHAGVRNSGSLNHPDQSCNW